MNKEIHELINMKERRQELEVELGTSNIQVDHLSHRQMLHIEQDTGHSRNTTVLLDMVNQTIQQDEQTIQHRH